MRTRKHRDWLPPFFRLQRHLPSDRRWNVGDLLEVLQGELVNIDNTAMIRGTSPVLDDEDF